MCLGVITTECTQAKCEKIFWLKKGSLILGIAIGNSKGEIKLYDKEIKCKVFIWNKNN